MILTKKKIKRNNEAVASVIIALLLFGLIITSLVTIQTVYVPRIIEQDEGLHMHEVADSFAELKHVIDIQTVTRNKIPISTPITLGVEVHSFLTSSRSFGSLWILPDNLTIMLSNDTNQQSYKIGSIRFASRNNYFVDQSYILEAGAFIISQPQGNIMQSDPARVLNDGEFEINFTFVNFSNIGGKASISGYGTYSIVTNFSGIISQNMTVVDSLVISTRYPNSWHLYLNSTLNDLGLNYGSDFTIDVTGSAVTVNIDDSIVVDIAIDIVKIIAQISPGWVK